MYREKDIPFEDGECVTAEYSLKDNGTVRVLNTQHYPEDGTYSQIEGYAQLNTFYPGTLNVIFFAEFGGNYRILSTDYDSYAVVYSCTDTLAGSISLFEFAWVLTREPLTKEMPEFERIDKLAREVFEEQLPAFDFENRMKITQQGGEDCKYHHSQVGKEDGK